VGGGLSSPGVSLVHERPIDGVELLRLDRPARRNALDTALTERVTAVLEELADDPDVRAVVLSTTSPRAFCAGADVEEPLDAAGGVARMEAFARLYAAIDALPVPSVCVCVGNVLGAGAELAAGSDLRVGGTNLKLGWVGARLGVPVGPARLVPLVGLARAKELIFGGRILDAAGARELGLVMRVVAPEDAEAAALELAGDIAARPPEGVRALKALFRELEYTGERVGRENSGLVAWQREGAGLPQGVAPTR
jgi:enoyl-CoA hydratase/carnithine racemase